MIVRRKAVGAGRRQNRRPWVSYLVNSFEHTETSLLFLFLCIFKMTNEIMKEIKRVTKHIQVIFSKNKIYLILKQEHNKDNNSKITVK